MKSKQLIFVTESNQQSKSDYMYIRAFIERFFVVDQNVRIVPIYMNGKGNFNSQTVEKKIGTAVKEYINGESIVVYCYDTDSINSDPYHQEFDKQINDYCQEKKYKIVYFCRDIEEVFVGKIIGKNEKKITAERFLRSRNIEKIDPEKFKSVKKKEKTSNLYLVLSDILVAKESN